MVHCAACPSKTSHIDLSEAYHCSKCGSYYHNSCGKRLMEDYGMQAKGIFNKCCGTEDDIAAHKKAKKKAGQGNSKNTKSNDASQQSLQQTSLFNTQLSPSNISASFSANLVNGTGYASEVEEISNADLLSQLKELITSNKAAINDVGKQLNEKINAVSLKLDTQQSQIDEAFLRIDNIEKSLDMRNNYSIEDTLFELNQRKTREINLIFYNVPDFNDEKRDKETIENLFDRNMAANKVIKSFRLINNRRSQQNNNAGNPSQKSGVPPLKVIFESSECVKWLFDNRNKLNLNGITFSSDKTVRQRALYSTAKAEMNRRLNNGETNLKIKILNGIPSVVSCGSNKMDHRQSQQSKNQQKGRN